MRLRNKVAVVTGGNSGIGFGIAEAFKNEGAVGAIAGRNQENLNRSVQRLNSSFIGLNADVTNEADLYRIFKETADKFGKIDALVVNAGGTVEGAQMGSVEDIGSDGYDKFMDLNLKSVYLTVQQALPYMNDGSSIILIGSTAAHRAAPGMTIYAAAKAAVISFAKGFSLDLLARRIRVNVLSPGTIDTPAFDKMVPAEQVEHVKKMWVDTIPAGIIGQPSDIGKAAVFLASDESTFVLGIELIVDGGMTNISLMK